MTTTTLGSQNNTNGDDGDCITSSSSSTNNNVIDDREILKENSQNQLFFSITTSDSNTSSHGVASISSSKTITTTTKNAANNGKGKQSAAKKSRNGWNRWKPQKLVPRLAPRRYIQRKRRPLLEEDGDDDDNDQGINGKGFKFQFQRKPPSIIFNQLPTLPSSIKSKRNDNDGTSKITNRLMLLPRANDQNGRFPVVPCMGARTGSSDGNNAMSSASFCSTSMMTSATATIAVAGPITNASMNTTTTSEFNATTAANATETATTTVPDSPPRELLEGNSANESQGGSLTNEELHGGCTTPRGSIQSHLSLSFDDPASLTPPAPSTTLPLVVSAKRLGNEVRRNHSSKRRRGRSFVVTTSGAGNGNSRMEEGDDDDTGMYNLKDPNFYDENGNDQDDENKENHNIFMSEWRSNGNSKQGRGQQRRRRVQCGGGGGGYYDDDDSSSSDQDCIITPSNLERLSPGERTRQYWLWCYGQGKQKSQDQEVLQKQPSWSASRKPPAKSCLSSTTQRNNGGGSVSSAPPTLDFYRRQHQRSQSLPLLELQHTPQQLAVRSVTLDTIDRYSTPNTSFDDSSSPLQQCSHGKTVQFGSTTAAEYEIDGPTDNMTPLAPEVANMRFPVLPKEGDEEAEEERETSEETKRNSEILAQWEDSFDACIDDDDDDDDDDDSEEDDPMDDDDEDGGLFGSRSNRRLGRHNRGSNQKSPRDNRRRSSGIFSPSEGSTSLLDDDDDDEEDPIQEDREEEEEEGNSSSESDVEVESNMACLAVESPLNDKKCTPPALKSIVSSSSSSGSECTEDLSRSSSSLSSDSCEGRKTTPPTDVRLSLEGVNTSGAAELDHASSPMDNTNKQLHGVLEQCITRNNIEEEQKTFNEQ
mmetsp:Transcript_26046/g.36732  ORF Transcript_26046/g.36732 Transcript_26046/m.36732 type:complete len:872 (+) Transcript_26046:26-2641(+)